MKSQFGPIEKFRLFTKAEVNQIIEAKEIASWISSYQQRAAINLLIEECGDDANLKNAILKMLAKFRVINIDEFACPLIDVMNKVAAVFENDKDETAIFGFSENLVVDGCGIPLNLMRRLNIFNNIEKKL